MVVSRGGGREVYLIPGNRFCWLGQSFYLYENNYFQDSNSMIASCICSRGADSPQDHIKKPDIPKHCKICGGQSILKKQGQYFGDMFSTVSLNICRGIDPLLNWKTASRGRARAPRRARTSFTTIVQKKTARKVVRRCAASNSIVSNLGEMSVSESEKLGVTILGRRFSDSFESVPIKKRRLLLVRSPSPPPCSPSQRLDESDNNCRRRNQMTTHLNGKQQSQEILPVGGNLSGSVDFSGISILAAAACNSHSANDILNSENSFSKGQEKDSLNSTVNLEQHQFSEVNFRDASACEDTTPLMITSSSTPSMLIEGVNAPEAAHFIQENCSSSHIVATISCDTVGKSLSSLQDEKFPWDLNEAVDVWENSDGGCFDSQHLSVGVKCDNDGDTENSTKQDFHEDLTAHENTCCPPKIDGNVTIDSIENSANKEVIRKFDYGNNSAMPDSNIEASLTNTCYESLQKHDSSSYMAERAEGSKLSSVSGSIDFEGENFSFISATSSHHCHKIPIAEDGISIPGIGSASETQMSSSSKMFKTDNCNENVSHLSETCPESNNFSRQRVSSDKKSDDSMLANSVGEESACVESYLDSKFHAKRIDSPLTEKVFSALVNGAIVTEVLGDSDGCIKVPKNEVVERCGTLADHIKEMVEIPSSSGQCGSRSEGVSDFKELKHGENLSGKERDDSQSSATVVSKLDPSDMICNVDNELKSSLVSGIAVHDTVDGGARANAPDACRSYIATDIKTSNTDAIENDLEYNYDSSVSKNDTQQAFGLENVDPRGDDDSQYEDGEFRESALCSWGIDDCEDGDIENEDYGSDNREIDAENAAIYHASPGSLSPNCSSRPAENQLKDVYGHADDTPLKSHSQSLNVDDDKQGTTAIKNTLRELGRRKDTGERPRGMIIDKPLAACSKVMEDKHLAKGESAQAFCHPASKLSGWDRLPKGSNVTDDLGSHRTKRYFAFAPKRYISPESRRRAVGTTPRKDVSPRIERLKPSEVPSQKDEAFSWGNRASIPDGSNHNIERYRDPVTSTGKGRMSLRRHDRGARGSDMRDESADLRRQNQNESSAVYGSPGFGQCCSKNAAEAAAAKVESNGFVVTADGTVVEPSSLESAGRISRQNANASSHSAQCSFVRRASTVERDAELEFEHPLDFRSARDISPNNRVTIGRRMCVRRGSGIATGSHMDSYNGPISNEDDDSFPIRRSYSNRDSNFSTRRGPLHLSRSRAKSRSRSRTRSPHAWASPEKKGDHTINGDTGIRQWNRSPLNFRSDARVERVRSPLHRHSGLNERVPNFAPPSESNVSPIHSSRYVCERKEHNNFRGYEYRHPSGRSSPSRLFSRNHRFDTSVCEQMNADEFHRPMRSGRYREFSPNRRPRFDGESARGGHGTRYELITSNGDCEIVSGVKRFRYHVDDGFRSDGSRFKNDSEFDARGSPRAFDRRNERQLEGSPRRNRVDKGQFRYGRNLRHGSFRSITVRGCSDEGNSQGRHS